MNSRMVVPGVMVASARTRPREHLEDPGDAYEGRPHRILKRTAFFR